MRPQGADATNVQPYSSCDGMMSQGDGVKPYLAPAAERWPRSAAACRAGAAHPVELAWCCVACCCSRCCWDIMRGKIDDRGAGCCGCCLTAGNVLPLLWGWQLQRRACAAAGACQLCPLRFFAWQLNLQQQHAPKAVPDNRCSSWSGSNTLPAQISYSF